MARRLALLLLMCTACECDQGGLLRVDVRTDYLPDIEFDEVGFWVDGSDYSSFNPIDPNADYVQGARVAEIPTGGATMLLLRGRLLLEGAPVAERLVQVEVRGRAAVTLVFTRDCATVSCPGAADAAEATQCEDARCVVPDCSPETPEDCPQERCGSDDDCPAPPATCATAVCVEGVCLEAGLPGGCEAGSACLPEIGCVAVEESDMGTPPNDMGPPPDLGNVDMGPPPECTTDDDCDDGQFCNGAERCAAGTCVGGAAPDCADSIACTDDACDEAGDRCTNAPNDARCTAEPGGTCGAGGCQYPNCTAANCVAGPCETASCVSDMCVRTSTCSGGEMCCAGACVPAGCDDGNPCTADSCGGSGCVNTPIAAGVTCGASACGPWGPCFGITCSDGQERRSCYDLQCDGAGACAMTNVMLDSRPCSKNDGDSCGQCNECSGGMTVRCPGVCESGCCIPI